MVYLPEHFAEHDTNVIHTLIEEHPLGLLITLGTDGLSANHIPFVLDRTFGEAGRLLGHVARNNAVWHNHAADQEALVVFQAAEAYISPNWYPTKQDAHRVVPTWNYAVAHVYGPLIIHDDEKWLRGQAGRLTKMMESPQPVPWKMADAPRDYLETMLASIVGIEIPIIRLVGKMKAGQNREMVDRLGAIDGLRGDADPGDAAMADVMAAKL
ncbi:MAG: FMN-binding negative transcriptional regulator [Chloroflexia bacterium]|nr:FMN-binding negative transcriptional regulator [Chloroflexia bacterium]